MPSNLLDAYPTDDVDARRELSHGAELRGELRRSTTSRLARLSTTSRAARFGRSKRCFQKRASSASCRRTRALRWALLWARPRRRPVRRRRGGTTRRRSRSSRPRRRSRSPWTTSASCSAREGPPGAIVLIHLGILLLLQPGTTARSRHARSGAAPWRRRTKWETSGFEPGTPAAAFVESRHLDLDPHHRRRCDDSPSAGDSEQRLCCRGRILAGGGVGGEGGRAGARVRCRGATRGRRCASTPLITFGRTWCAAMNGRTALVALQLEHLGPWSARGDDDAICRARPCLHLLLLLQRVVS